MGIANWFSNGLEKKERTLTRDLLSMAIADGEFSEKERLEILRICEEENISDVELMDSLRGKDINIPKTKEEKFSYIAHLISVMNADGKSSPVEVHLLKVLANKVGFNIEELMP